MTLNEFLKYVETRKPLKGDEIHQFMNKMSDEARRMTFELNKRDNSSRISSGA